MIFNMIYGSGDENFSGPLPVFDFGEDASAYQLIDEGNDNWMIKLKSSGILKFNYLGSATNGLVDIFLVGGGGGGGAGYGGGGGFTKTETSIVIAKNTEYSVIVGTGGGSNTSGGETSFNGIAVNGGGAGGIDNKGGNGGSGGGGFGNERRPGDGGSCGNNGTGSQDQQYINYSWEWYYLDNYGTGQGTPTTEFGEDDGQLYAGGGGGGSSGNSAYNTTYGYGGSGGGGDGAGVAGETIAAKNGGINTGGGGGGGYGDYVNASGGSGIVIIRNHREVTA